MAANTAELPGWSAPLGWIGRKTIAGIAYVGGAGLLLGSAARAIVFPRGAGPAFLPALMWQLSRLFAMGLPLVAMVHVSLGSFLAMQAYFGGTFVDGTGAVTGVGLVRNAAPLMSGFVLAAVMAARVTPELRARVRPTPEGSADPAPDPGRFASARIVAAMFAGPVFGLFGAVVGMLVGWRVAGTLLGVSTDSFLHMFTEMLWYRDVVGLLVKGLLFGLFAGLFACHEGLRGGEGHSTPTAAVRATCLASLAIMIVNSSWFLLVYHAGPPFGPTLLAPPTL